MDSTIRVDLYAGLCNRMRVLASAIELAKWNNSSLDVIWNLERKFNCRFEELFLVPSSVNKIVYRDLHTLSGNIARNLIHFRSGGYDIRLFKKDINKLRYNNLEFETLTKGKRIYISTDSDFIRHDARLKEFTVEESLAGKISSYTDHVNQAVGVHIRRTDHKKAKIYSPTSLFIEKMDKEISEQPETRFFLATDSPEVEDRLVARFGDRIITHPKRSLNRDDPDAIKDALIDLYCLASCKKIFGSYWSSFTDTASEIYGAERIIVKLPKTV